MSQQLGELTCEVIGGQAQAVSGHGQQGGRGWRGLRCDPPGRVEPGQALDLGFSALDELLLRGVVAVEGIKQLGRRGRCGVVRPCCRDDGGHEIQVGKERLSVDGVGAFQQVEQFLLDGGDVGSQWGQVPDGVMGGSVEAGSARLLRCEGDGPAALGRVEAAESEVWDCRVGAWRPLEGLLLADGTDVSEEDVVIKAGEDDG
ncbi:hypothetical protein ABIE67_009606 [Streptomyces sp. V4I8]|uniref:hypothetical protein n=1 Tax=Streptomyces sp. V4I8 TaxID=3156469 RepID=UPI0035166ABC